MSNKPTYEEAIAKLKACPHRNQSHSFLSIGGPFGMEPVRAWRYCNDCHAMLVERTAPKRTPIDLSVLAVVKPQNVNS